MNEPTIALTVMTFLIFLVFAGFLIWGIKSKQFHDVEEPKYRMLETDRSECEDESGQEERGDRK